MENGPDGGFGLRSAERYPPSYSRRMVDSNSRPKKQAPVSRPQLSPKESFGGHEVRTLLIAIRRCLSINDARC